MPPLSPAPQIPASNQFLLTIPITSYTIILPASLRSDRLIGISRNRDRHHAGMLIAFPGIRSCVQKQSGSSNY
jgi:hypothetical protein